MARLASILLVISCLLGLARGHGRLFEPPGRSTAWRFGFGTPENVNDHELFCGGFTRQWVQNDGRCGICGDPWDQAQPRDNEAGGKYGRGVIVRTYSAGSAIPIGVELTANHKGFFEMRVCPINGNDRPATQRCLDKYKLQLADGGGVRYYPPATQHGKIRLRYKLPAQLTCSQCVLQWRYVAGNNWGRCENGTERVGCGPQEEFRACADVRVVNEDGTFDEQRYDWEDGEVGWEEEPQDVARVRYTETLLAYIGAALLVLLAVSAACCCLLWRRRRVSDSGSGPAAGGRKKRGVTFGKQIFLISNPTLTRAGKLAKPSQPAEPEHADTSAIYEVSSSDGSTASRTVAQFASDESSPEPPVPPRRKRPSKMTPVEECDLDDQQDSQDQEDSSRGTPILEVSRPTQVTVNGVSVTPDPPPIV